MTDEKFQIDTLQKRQREIEKLTGKARNAEYDQLVREYNANHRRLGRLLLARDKSERPHIYA